MKKQKAELESLTMELEQKIRRLQFKSDTLQIYIFFFGKIICYKVLVNSYRALEKELELIKMEK